METIGKLLTDVAQLLGWPYAASIKIASELEALAEMRDILTITQQQVDQLTAEITANSDAIALAAKSIEPLQASIAAATVQIAALNDKLINAGVPFNSDALDAALAASAAQAKALGDSLAATPAPVVPTAPVMTDTAPVAADTAPVVTETVQVAP